MPPKRKAIGRSLCKARKAKALRLLETDKQQEARLESNRIRIAQSRQTVHIDLKLAAFHYNANYNYSLTPSVVIGKMDKLCAYCHTLIFKNKTAGMCCSHGKVKLPLLHPPIESLLSLLSGELFDYKHFLRYIRKYNSAFQMTSFGATKVKRHNFIPIFKIPGQVYHRVGSLLPVPDAEHKFFQIYFMSNNDLQVNRRCGLIPENRRHIFAKSFTTKQRT